MSWVLLTERGLLWGSALCPRLKGEGKEFLGPSLCLAHALQISLVSGCAIPEWEKLLSNTSLVVSSLPDAAFWEDFWRDFSGRFQMGKEAANFREMGPRLTCCDAPECERWGSAEGWLLFALLYLWVLLVCPPSRLGYASLHFHLLPFQNPSSSLGFLSSEEEFLKAQNFTSSPPLSPPLILFPLLNVSFLVCFFFYKPKIKVERPGMALGHRDVGVGWPASPAELSHGWSPGTLCPIFGQFFSLQFLVCCQCIWRLVQRLLGPEECIRRILLLSKPPGQEWIPII